MAEVEDETDVENSTSFWTSFTSRIGEMRLELKTLLPDVVADAEKLQQIKLQLSGLQTYATESTPLLPAYDVRRSQEEIEIIGKIIKDTELLLKPKKKFTFAARSSNTKVPAAMSSDIPMLESKAENQSANIETDRSEIYPPGSYVVSSRNNEFISLSPKDMKLISAYGANVQLLLKDCDNVVISSPTLHGSIRLEKMNNCQIYLGPCCTSVYVEECSNMTIFLACHQLRIHRSHNCLCYVKVNSHPIIEDCTGFGFAPYSLSYDTIFDDYKSSSLLEASCWDNVVDFRWHRNNVRSPHWYLLPIETRLIELPLNLIQAGWKLILDIAENKIENENENENGNGNGNKNRNFNNLTDLTGKTENIITDLEKEKTVFDPSISSEKEKKKEEEDIEEEL